MKKMTDWDNYYQNRLHLVTRITRVISTKKICAAFAGIFSEFSSPVTVCELGGGNSFFLAPVCEQFTVKRYHVIDNNTVGLKLLASNSMNAVLTSERADVLDRYDGAEKFDIVFSVGLIEHFETLNTHKAIAFHFDRCSPGGFVMITFPTPTWLYRLSRKLLETFNMWNFPDERPLKPEEVIREIEKFGTVRTCSINWWIGLTQCYILAKKAG